MSNLSTAFILTAGVRGSLHKLSQMGIVAIIITLFIFLCCLATLPIE